MKEHNYKIWNINCQLFNKLLTREVRIPFINLIWVSQIKKILFAKLCFDPLIP